MSGNTVIKIDKVNKSFKTVHAVKDLSLSIYEGEYVALLGPNGAGKTTLIEMIEGIQTPDDGSIELFGMNWKTHEQKLHELIGLSLQETSFIEKLTAKETLNLFASFYGLGNKITEEILDLVNLQSKKNSYTTTLSGGQKQRLALGVALLNKPKILLLDEPTTGLDPGARREIWKILERLKKEIGTTMILTTHYMEEAEVLCDRILIMDQGKFIAEGKLDELNAKYGEGDIIEVTFEQAFDIETSGMKGIRKIQWEEPMKKVRIFVDKVSEALPSLIEVSSKNSIKISELSSRKMTLDDLFISMTGRHLHE